MEAPERLASRCVTGTLRRDELGLRITSALQNHGLDSHGRWTRLQDGRGREGCGKDPRPVAHTDPRADTAAEPAIRQHETHREAKQKGTCLHT